MEPPCYAWTVSWCAESNEVEGSKVVPAMIQESLLTSSGSSSPASSSRMDAPWLITTSRKVGLHQNVAAMQSDISALGQHGHIAALLKQMVQSQAS